MTFVQAVAIACGVLLGGSPAWAGWYDAATTLRLSNATVAPRDAKTATIRFDVTWERSWRHEVNHDAAWVFFKVKPAGATEWQHVRLAADRVLNPAGYGQAEGTPLDFIVPGGPEGFAGMFLRRAEFGQGTVKATKVSAVWDMTAATGVTMDVKTEVRACGIEMVYVPEGSFLLGWEGKQPNAFYMYTDGAHTDTPYRVTGPGAIPTGRAKGKLWALGAEPEDGGEIPADFPNGYAAMYYMKSHIKRGPYADFLNTLPPEQAAGFYRERKTPVERKGTPPNYVYWSTEQDWGHHQEGLNWAEAAAYAAWAGLRPMTELEYEKAMRGPMEPGWAQGTEQSHKIAYPTFWGMYDSSEWMTWAEHPVTVANAKGRSFRGTHGSGKPELPGDWPQADGLGSGTRGGWDYIHPSNRKGATDPAAPERRGWYVWRGVRTAPKEAAQGPVTGRGQSSGAGAAAAGDGEKAAKSAATPTVENVKLTARDDKTALVAFDIAWEDSWRHGRLHDAVWVFFRLKTGGGADWQPLRLAADKVINPAGFGAGTGTPLEFVVPADEGGGVGMFVRRAKDGNGKVVARGVTAIADLESLAGIRQLNKAKVLGFGIEMAYVAEGPFYVGASAKELNGFHTWPDAGKPYRVTTAGPIPTGRQDGKLWALGMAPEDGGEIPASFPNGYRAYYCMKYLHFKQELYAGFLNTIDAEQAKTHWYCDYQGVAISRSGRAPNYTYTATAPNARCPWLSWADGSAVAAWAGLRPMTELEFEKAVRGLRVPAGPRDAPVSFWGLLETSTGAIYERPISAGSADGRKFAGSHGRGTLGLPADWPVDTDCIAYRGDYAHVMGYQRIDNLCTSGRIKSITCHSNRRNHPFAGWRAVRTAPVEAGEPIGDRFPPGVATPVPRAAGPGRPEAVPIGWGEPLAALVDCADVYPTQNRYAPNEHTQDFWQGPADASAKVYLAEDGRTLYVGALVTDDRHFNNKTGDEIRSGDALQMGLVAPDGVHWNIGLALTRQSVVFHQWAGKGDTLGTTAEYVAVRDDDAKTTRYELRLPWNTLGIKPGAQFSFNVVVFDDDDGNGHRYWLELAPGLAGLHNVELYPRFVLAK
jgi:hypothetical protein